MFSSPMAAGSAVGDVSEEGTGMVVISVVKDIVVGDSAA